ncbi:MAG: DUF3558 family protein [Mycobacteriaceae bacterium]
MSTLVAAVGVVAVCVVAVLVSACTSSTGGEAQPSDASGPSRLSPPITAKQLDVTAAVANPCGMVTVSSLAPFKVSRPGVIEQTVIGPACNYDPPTIDYPRISISVETKTGGLEGAYQRRASFNRFETGMLRGYPTVNMLQGVQPGICNISVAVNDRELINVDFVGLLHERFHDDPCTPAMQVLTLALQGVGG